MSSLRQLVSVVAAVGCLLTSLHPLYAELRVGAAVVDVTPSKFPVLVNGGMLSRSVSDVNTPVNARAIVLDDGQERIAIVVVDSCMMPQELLDEAKQLAAARTKIRVDRMMISATHTHTAPSSMGALGTSADPNYIPLLREKLAESIAAAEANLEPAKVGWAVRPAAKYTALRRWIRRPDRIAEDPFGNPTVRANMHAANNWDDVIGESGPEDPDLSLISFQSKTGRPLAILANFSMHYFGDKAIGADYFGLFSQGLTAKIASDQENKKAPFVGILSHGCSGDIWRRDYSVVPESRFDPTIQEYSDGLVELAVDAYETIEHQDVDSIEMAEARLPLKYRVPDQQRLQWAKQVVADMGDRLPKTQTEVYAREQILLDQMQSTKVVVQAIRIGSIGIATTPNETYALTGLKIKLQSPLEHQMVIELANGGDGYIPPPEQHFLGGYNTWPARSAGLEIQAEPKITETALHLLEQVSAKPRREFLQSQGAATQAILQAKPLAFWRLHDFAGPVAIDSSPHGKDALFEEGVVFFLDGPQSKSICATEIEKNRAVHFAGGRLRANLPGISDKYSISLWFWNGMPNDGRDTTGWIFSRDFDFGLSSMGDHLGLAGTASKPGCLIFQHGDRTITEGSTVIERWTWNHLLLVRDGENVKVYLNGQPNPELECKAPAKFPRAFAQFFFGGRSDNVANWEGRLDEIAVFERAISPAELKHSK